MLNYKDVYFPNLCFENKYLSQSCYEIELWLGEMWATQGLGYRRFWKVKDEKKLKFLGEVRSKVS